MTHLATTICPSNHHIQSIHIITFTLRILEKNSDIINGDRDNKEGGLH